MSISCLKQQILLVAKLSRQTTTWNLERNAKLVWSAMDVGMWAWSPRLKCCSWGRDWLNRQWLQSTSTAKNSHDQWGQRIHRLHNDQHKGVSEITHSDKSIKKINWIDVNSKVFEVLYCCGEVMCEWMEPIMTLVASNWCLGSSTQTQTDQQGLSEHNTTQ